MSANHNGSTNDRLQTHKRNDAVRERHSRVAVGVRKDIAEVANVAEHHQHSSIIEPATNRLALFGPPCVMLVGL